MSGHKKAPLNTTARASTMTLMFEGLLGGTSGAIERQEAEGQASFVQSDTLPALIRNGGQDDLAAAGVKFLGPVDGDEMFQYVELPAGWEKRPTDHSMWSGLFDADGREVGSIFYKAAFYDRDAFLNINQEWKEAR